MFVRAFLLFLVTFAAVFAVFWTVFRTRFLNSRRVVEIIKCSALTLASMAFSALVIAVVISLDKLS